MSVEFTGGPLESVNLALLRAKLTYLWMKIFQKEEFKLVLNICFLPTTSNGNFSEFLEFVSRLCLHKTFANKHQLCIKCQPYPRLCNCHQPNYTKPLARISNFIQGLLVFFFFHESYYIWGSPKFLDVKNYATMQGNKTRREEGEIQWGEVGNFWWSLTSHIILYIFLCLLSPIQSISNILKLFKHQEIP